MPSNSSLSSGSVPGISASDCSVIATSATVFSIGPAVSRETSIGAMPKPGTRPSVGFSPTISSAVDGLMIEPPVSVPIVSVDEPGGLGRARARRGAARARGGVVRVQHLAGQVAEARRLAAEAVRPLGQTELAEDHDAVCAQVARHAGVLFGERFAQRPVARRGVHRRRVDDVLQQDRHAHRRAEDVMPWLRSLSAFLASSSALRVDLRDRVQARSGLVERLRSAPRSALTSSTEVSLPSCISFSASRPVSVFEVQRSGLGRGSAEHAAHGCEHECSGEQEPPERGCGHVESFL